MINRYRQQAGSYKGGGVDPHKHKPRHGAGVCDVPLQPYTSAATAALKVALGRMALLISSAIAPYFSVAAIGCTSPARKQFGSAMTLGDEGSEYDHPCPVRRAACATPAQACSLTSCGLRLHRVPALQTAARGGCS